MGKRGPAASYKPDYCTLARKFCLLGATNEDLAGLFEVSQSTIGNWIAAYPAFKAAINEGRTMADADVAESLQRRAKGYDHPAVKILQGNGEALVVPYTQHYPPETKAAMFWLRNRRRQQWREKIELEHTVLDELLEELDAAGERARNARRR